MKPVLEVLFFATGSGNEPVLEWLRGLPAADRRSIGEDIKTVQFGWPMGMPLVRSLGGGILVLLHGFIKKQQATPQPDLALARERLKQLKRG